MSEEVVFDEMIEAGRLQVQESSRLNMTDEQIAVRVYLAMRGVFVMATARGDSESVH